MRLSRSGDSSQRLALLADLEARVLLPLGEVLLLFFLELRRLAALGRQLALDVVDLALQALHVLDAFLDGVDEAALDHLGELDATDQLRERDAGAHRLPARFAVRADRALRHLGDLGLALLPVAVRLGHGVDLLQYLAGALFDALVGDLLVVEDHQLTDRSLAGPQLIAHVDDGARDGRRARDRLDDGQLAALDALGDLDLALTREQRHGAHLAQVHADGIVGLVERAWREIELGFVAGAAAVGAFAEELVLAILLLRIDDFDAGVAEGAEQVVQLLGRGDVSGQQLVDLLVEQVALLLAHGDELPHFVVFLFDRQRPFLLPAPLYRIPGSGSLTTSPSRAGGYPSAWASRASRILRMRSASISLPPPAPPTC